MSFGFSRRSMMQALGATALAAQAPTRQRCHSNQLAHYGRPANA